MQPFVQPVKPMKKYTCTRRMILFLEADSPHKTDIFVLDNVGLIILQFQRDGILPTLGAGNYDLNAGRGFLFICLDDPL
jgi:hypothetical protein